MLDFHSNRLVKSTRKAAVCEHCGAVIPVGSRAIRFSQLYDGDFSSGALHPDCQELWNELYHLVGYDEGASWDIGDMLRETNADPEEAQGCLDHLRGRFPHAVCRVEFRMRQWLEAAE